MSQTSGISCFVASHQQCCGTLTDYFLSSTILLTKHESTFASKSCSIFQYLRPDQSLPQFWEWSFKKNLEGVETKWLKDARNMGSSPFIYIFLAISGFVENTIVTGCMFKEHDPVTSHWLTKEQNTVDICLTVILRGFTASRLLSKHKNSEKCGHILLKQFTSCHHWWIDKIKCRSGQEEELSNC